MATSSCDLVVIGSGPAGEGAAMRAVKAGRKVVVVERYSEVGGSCTHWATIPSKALRFAVRQLMDAHHSPYLRQFLRPQQPSFPELVQLAGSVVHKQVDLRQTF